ncbi:hypothetical protein BKA57DRAFT_455685 [Linnemannia elongata]|nr:hypothetical protein BKA57DRAFT_455685 [Linnemannia elongata]
MTSCVPPLLFQYQTVIFVCSRLLLIFFFSPRSSSLSLSLSLSLAFYLHSLFIVSNPRRLRSLTFTV